MTARLARSTLSLSSFSRRGVVRSLRFATTRWKKAPFAGSLLSSVGALAGWSRSGRSCLGAGKQPVAPAASPGQQPVVKTTGRRKAYKVFGLIEYFSGRLFYQGIDGRFNGPSYVAFLTRLLEQPTAPLFLVHDGAPYHRAAPVKAFVEQHGDRLHVPQLPGYSPDYNPIEFLWRATTRQATHNRYFPEFADLIGSVEEALAAFAAHPDRVKALFGRYLDDLAVEPTATATVVAAA